MRGDEWSDGATVHGVQKSRNHGIRDKWDRRRCRFDKNKQRIDVLDVGRLLSTFIRLVGKTLCVTKTQTGI